MWKSESKWEGDISIALLLIHDVGRKNCLDQSFSGEKKWPHLHSWDTECSVLSQFFSLCQVSWEKGANEKLGRLERSGGGEGEAEWEKCKDTSRLGEVEGRR